MGGSSSCLTHPMLDIGVRPLFEHRYSSSAGSRCTSQGHGASRDPGVKWSREFTRFHYRIKDGTKSRASKDGNWMAITSKRVQRRYYNPTHARASSPHDPILDAKR